MTDEKIVMWADKNGEWQMFPYTVDTPIPADLPASAAEAVRRGQASMGMVMAIVEAAKQPPR